jgi:hypothetical protein
MEGLDPPLLSRADFAWIGSHGAGWLVERLA